jgi:hypothetical protein
LKVPAVTLASLTFPSDFANGIASVGKSTPLPPLMNVRGELSGPTTDPYKNVDRELLQNNLYYKGYSPVGNNGLPQSALDIDPAKVRAMRDGGAIAPIVPGATAESEEEPAPGAITVFADMNKPLLTLPSAPTSLISEESGSLYAPVQRHNGQ